MNKLTFNNHKAFIYQIPSNRNWIKLANNLNRDFYRINIKIHIILLIGFENDSKNRKQILIKRQFTRNNKCIRKRKN